MTLTLTVTSNGTVYSIPTVLGFDPIDHDPHPLYCKHGVRVGGYGPDYMCGYCEDGTSDQDFVTGLAWRRIHRDRYLFAILVATITRTITDEPTMRTLIRTARTITL